MPEIPTTSVCPKCGCALSPNAPRSLCAKCLFAVMLEGDSFEVSPRPKSSGLALPRTFGAYELIEEVARGGMGIVFRARQKEINRIVALKVLAAGQFAAPDFVQRFRTEAEAAAHLDHPNIVPIYEVGEWEGQPFFSMKYFEGGSLAQWIGGLKESMSNRAAAELVVKLARAVHYAHQHGILHRDIKPGNVLLNAQREPHLTDFGLAKLVEKDSTLTRTMAMLGTPSYMSPEQARGEAKQLTTAVDVYGLGAVLYELLTGQPPFAGGTTMETVRLVLDAEPRRPSAIKPGLDRDLETICLKCLEKEKARRYGSADALAADLDRWLRRLPIEARRTRRLRQAYLLCRRNPAQALLLFLLAVTLASGLAGIFSQWQRADGLRQRAETGEHAARRRAYASDMILAQQALAENNLGRARELIDRQRPHVSPGPDLRGWEWRYLWQQCRSDALFTLARNQGSVYALAVSPDGRWLVSGGEDKSPLTLWDLATRRPAKFLVEGVLAPHAKFSPVAPLLAYVSVRLSKGDQPAYHLHLWSVATQADAGSWPLPGKCVGLAFSEDGKVLLAATDAPQARFTFWNVPTGEVRSTIETAPLRKSIGTPFAATRDLRWVATGHDADTLRLTDTRTGRTLWEVINPGSNVDSLAIDPTETVLAAGYHSAESFIQLYHLATGQEMGVMPVRSGYIIALEFAKGGQTLISAGSDQTITQWDVRQRRPLATLRGHSLEVWRLAPLPDGRTLISGSGNGEIMAWDLETARSHELRLTLPVVPRFCWRFTPDSASIITCDHDGRVFRWKGRDFREPRLLLEMGEGIMSALVSEDCRTVAASFQNGVIRVWNLAERALRREMDTRDGSTMLWGFADESNRLLAVSDRDLSLHEWNLASGVEEIPEPGLEDWQIRGAFPIASRHHYAGRSVAAHFERLGATGTRRHSHHARRWFTGAFSHDQRYFAYQHTVGSVVVEDPKTSRELATLRGFLQGVHSLAFSPDGQRLAVGSDDRQAVKLWDLESFQELVTLGGNGTAYSQTRFSPDGSVLGTMNSRGILHLWRAPSWEAIATAERALEREPGPSHSGDW